MITPSDFFLSSSQQRLFALGLPVLMYHKVAQPPARTLDPFLYHSPERFASQLAELRQAGFTSGTLADVERANGNVSKKIVITFDDGCENVFRNALEILARHQFSAIQFLVSDFLGRRNEWDVAKGDVSERLMDASQIKEWLAAGHEIGSHTATHPNLRKVGPDQLREEISGSRKSLEDAFGISIRHFCYPFGSWNPAVRDAVEAAGYSTACTTQSGVNTQATPRFALHRITPLSGGEWLAKAAHRIRRKLSGG